MKIKTLKEGFEHFGDVTKTEREFNQGNLWRVNNG